MNATLTAKDETTQYSFALEHGGKNYDVTIWLNAKGKFIDDEISLNSEILDFQGEDGQIREDILTYLDANWEKLV